MHTNNDVKTFLYKYIKAHTTLYDAVIKRGGDLYKTQRPLNSSVDDCVVSILTMVNGLYGKATAYVNIYVQDIQRGDEYIEDTITTAYFEKEVAKAFDNYRCCTDIYRVKVESVLVLNVNNRNEHCVNTQLSIDIVNF